MKPTTLGMNRTGAAMSPARTQEMVDATNQYAPPGSIDISASQAERLLYIKEAESVGSIPPTLSVKGMLKTGMAALKGSHPSIFMDKIGERIAFERAAVRLYEALLMKYEAVSQAGNLQPPEQFSSTTTAGTGQQKPPMGSGKNPAHILQRIRADELEHFKMLCDVMTQLGGDPTAQTPCADVQATASMGLFQVVTDPRTTFAQSLNAILTAELSDNAGWELLMKLSDDAGETNLTRRFNHAFEQEQVHLATIKGWLSTLVLQGAGTPAL
jgi:bacterioferritin (cytochrome b1)